MISGPNSEGWEPQCAACRGVGDIHGHRCLRCGGSGDAPVTSGPHEHAERIARDALLQSSATGVRVSDGDAKELAYALLAALAELEQAKRKLAREQARKRAAKAAMEQALDLLAACWDELGRDQYYVDPALRKPILALVSDRIKNDVHGFLAGSAASNKGDGMKIVLVMRRTAWLRLKLWSFRNWRRGFAFGPVARCRNCQHTIYALPCPYCSAAATTGGNE